MTTGAIVFDLETKRLANEVGGWNFIDRLGFAAGVTFDVQGGFFTRYLESDAEELIQQIRRAESVVGFNLLRFDYTVLRPYGLHVDRELQEKTIDLLQHIDASLGFRIGLDNIASATTGAGKSSDGVQSVTWYREGRIDQVLDYCEADVKVTYEVWRFGRENGFVNYLDRWGSKRKIRVTW
jgi:DEAD/DEAH box helicase domain-containing protein